LRRGFQLIEFFLPKLEGEKSEKKKMKKTENEKIEVNLETDTVIIEYKLDYIYQTDEYLDQSKNKFEDLKNEDLKNKEQELKRTQAKKDEAVNKIGKVSIIVILLSTICVLVIKSSSFIIVFVLFLLIYMLTGLNISPSGSKVDKYYAQVMLYKCDRCLRDFAYKEIVEPDILEVSTPEDYKVIITKYFKCRYCGHEIIRKEPYVIKVFKGDYNFFGPKTISEVCIKCQYQRIFREFRKPDIQQLSSGEFIKTRYYKCEYCGDIKIKREKYWSEPYYGN
jgi:DNA-directed RNA polymerase subunit RPC12/RpoP